MLEDHHKADVITKYIQSANVNEDIDVEQLQQGLKQLLGEQPAIKLEWTASNVINEVSGKQEGRIEKLLSVKVFYTTADNQIKQVEYYV